MNKISCQFLFWVIVVALTTWGLGNVFYWEIWKGYPACIICKWHRTLYLILFCLSVSTCKNENLLLRWLVIVIVGMEVAVSTTKIFTMLCQNNICRYISVPDKLNFVFGVVAFLSLLTIQIILYKRKL